MTYSLRYLPRYLPQYDVGILSMAVPSRLSSSGFPWLLPNDTLWLPDYWHGRQEINIREINIREINIREINIRVIKISGVWRWPAD